MALLILPKEKWIFPHSGTDCHEHYYISNRFSFADTPAVRLGGNMACDLASTSLKEISLIDLFYDYFVSTTVTVSGILLYISKLWPLCTTNHVQPLAARTNFP